MNNQMPTGTVTLMFTDIEGHTKMWEQMGDDFMPILEAHNAILRSAAAKCNGYEVKTEGDAFMLNLEGLCLLLWACAKKICY